MRPLFMVDKDPGLYACSLFLNLEDEIIAEILSDSEVKEYPVGAVFIEKGKVPDALFIITKGKVGIYNEDVLLAQLEPYSMMGESFLADASATATIVTLTDVSTVEIKRELFYKLAVKHPRLVFNIFNINFQRLRNSNDIALKEAHEREAKLEKLVNERTKELFETMEVLRSTNTELSITRDNLIETQKFRQQFLANMSHEIRTPMNAIVGLTNLLIKTPVNEQQEKYLQVIKKSGANLLVIINDILDLAKIESGKMELESVPFPLINAVHNIQTILSLKAEEKGIKMIADIGSDVPEYVLGDETRITQVIMNLAGNAIKFTEKGSVKLSVTIESKDKDTYRVHFSLKDTGIGIPEDKLDTIFESFGQASSATTRKFGGTGLGLTISRQLVEMHGGELKVRSTFGKGSEFYFTIPYVVADKPAEEVGAEFGDQEKLAGMKILLVEDNEFNQMVAVDTLQDLFPDLKVDVALHGKEAVAMVQESDYRFVFMDIQMPEMDGYEATREIRKLKDEHKKNIRICAMTANVTKEEIDKCLAVGMNDYLMKPFDQEVLREKVLRNALEGD
ncbi:MAG TPA: ATP-binding protein [Bacteroidia bacterium]|nr:ATP-binding protein [Bacteroidia bacterium]HNS11616.1 ATP-binding protein [Bacteroidia bacterium]